MKYTIFFSIKHAFFFAVITRNAIAAAVRLCRTPVRLRSHLTVVGVLASANCCGAREFFTFHAAKLLGVHGSRRRYRRTPGGRTFRKIRFIARLNQRGTYSAQVYCGRCSERVTECGADCFRFTSFQNGTECDAVSRPLKVGTENASDSFPYHARTHARKRRDRADYFRY